MNSSSALLTVADLSVNFPASRQSPSHRGLDRVSFELAAGQSLGVVGRSGSGKSTLARVLSGLLVPSSGTVSWGSIQIHNLSHRQRLRQGIRIQMIFQDPGGSLDPSRKIRWSLSEARRYFPAQAPQSPDTIESALSRVGLDSDTADRYPHQLSGGQKQRVCIARALLSKPDLLICDEPVSALDVTTQAQILKLLSSLQSQDRFSLIFIGHDLAVVRYLCQIIMVLEKGKLVEMQPADKLIQKPFSQTGKGLVDAARAHAQALNE
ncbi:MAG: ABC transporter ATP-binding protein [Puniceicoccaceae bacterium]